MRVVASQIRTVWSRLPLAILLPSGDHATLSTFEAWPVNGSPIGVPVAASIIRTVANVSSRIAEPEEVAEGDLGSVG